MPCPLVLEGHARLRTLFAFRIRTLVLAHGLRPECLYTDGHRLWPRVPVLSNWYLSCLRPGTLAYLMRFVRHCFHLSYIIGIVLAVSVPLAIAIFRLYPIKRVRVAFLQGTVAPVLSLGICWRLITSPDNRVHIPAASAFAVSPRLSAACPATDSLLLADSVLSTLSGIFFCRLPPFPTLSRHAF